MSASRWFVVVLGLYAAGCGSSSPASPSGGGSQLTAPVAQLPDDQAQLTVMRPTLIVANVTSGQSGAKTYEFEISDKSDFSTSSTSRLHAFTVVAHSTAVPEGPNGTTSYTPDFDLQPTTRLYWRARVVQGTAASSWSPTRSFNTPVTGYSRAGELYDPLVNGSTVGIPVGATSFVAGKGLKLGDGNSYVRYQLQQPLSSGEFSMEVEGLHANGPGSKLKVFSMMDGTGDLYRSDYLFNVQYRGAPGNPDNCISFKALFGDPAVKLEPDGGQRSAAVMALDPSRAYFWKAEWRNGVTVTVKDGINGGVLYNLGITVDSLGLPISGAAYNPNPHFAYLGANNGPFGEEDGSWPGAIYRNVWISSRPRPASLGSALRPY